MIGTRMRMRLAVVTLGGASLLLAGCSGSSPNPPSASGAGGPTGHTGSSSPGATRNGSPTSSTAAELTSQILGAGQAAQPLVSVAGNLVVIAAKVPAVAEILEVRAGAKSTLLRWQLKSASGGRVASLGFSLSRPPLFDTRGVTVRDATGKRVLSPFTYVPTQRIGDVDTGCVCSQLPSALGSDPEPMYALYPPLSAGTSTVDVVLPGFAVAKGVAVTR